MEACNGKNQREVFTLKVDSIRKSLNIENMEDVEKLVLCFFDQLEKQKRAEREEDAESGSHKPSEEKKDEDMEGESKMNHEFDGSETLDSLDLDDVLVVLESFNEKRKLDAQNQDIQGNPRMGKKNNAETEE